MGRFYKTIILLGLLNAHFAFSEEAITKFNEKFALSFFGNYNIGSFTQQEALNYRTDIPWNIGLGVRYKKISAQISIPISFNNPAFDLELNSYFEKIYFNLFIKHYQNFYNDKDIEQNDAGLDIFSTGITAGWIHNNKNHSLSSVYNLDGKQNISSGSFLYGFGIFYSSIYSENEDIIRYKERKHIIYFGPMAGYSYTWILPHDMFINVFINIGANLGINSNTNEILFIPQIKPKISFGHHNNSWSINMVMGCNITTIIWGKNDTDTLLFAPIAITFSKRF